MTTLLALTPAGESLVWSLVILFLIGLIVGAIARLLVPGPTPMGVLGTAAAGVAGAIIGGLIASRLGAGEITELNFVGFVAAVGASTALLAIAQAAGGGRGRLGRERERERLP